MRRVTLRPALIAGVLLSGIACAASAAPVAIVGGAIVTEGPAGTLARGVVVIDDGKIIAVGADVSPPPGAHIIDATGKIVTPGLLSPASNVGLPSNDPTGLESQAGGVSDRPLADEIYRAFNPQAPDVLEAGVDGGTSAILLPQAKGGAVKSGALFSGGAAAVELSGAFDFLIRPDVARVYSLDVAAEAAGGLNAALPRLARYLADSAAAGPSASGKPAAPRTSDEDVRRRILNGETPLIVEVERAVDILNVLQVTRPYKVRLILLGASEGWRVAPQIAAAGASIIVNADANLPQDFSRLFATYQNAARLAAAGVPLAFMGETHLGPMPRAPRPPRFVAGRAVAYGVDHETALASVTITPARMFGLDGELGSLEMGKRADLVVWSGDPLEVTSHVDHLFVRGVEPPPSRSALLRDKYKRLADCEAQAAPCAGGVWGEPRRHSPDRPSPPSIKPIVEPPRPPATRVEPRR